MSMGDELIMIISMAAILFATRVSGIVIGQRLPDTPRIRAVLEVMPGVTLVALVAPDIVHAGFAGVIAAGVVVAIVRTTGQVGLGMIAGLAVVSLWPF